MENIEGLLRLVPEHRERIQGVVRPYADMVPTAAAPVPTGSYVGGHPFVPAGTAAAALWPRDQTDTPMHFLVQVNFADVPPLPGYPTAGMLQWFVATDVAFGLFGDDTDSADDSGSSGLPLVDPRRPHPSTPCRA